ncbi:hypothetical protein SUGI_0212980 [Cryptomeria japonica]|nr:hypothetical protein SUGI_0212980 [Cryptomeria japonica]
MYMAPIAALLLLPITLFVEGNVAAMTIVKARENPFIIFLLQGNMMMAYLVNLTNFLITKHSSLLTLQVLGNAKVAVVVVILVLIFKNPVTLMGMIDFVITIMGLILYNEVKKRFKAPH